MIFQLRPISEYDLQQIKHINDLVQLIPWSMNEILSEFEQNDPTSLCICGVDGKVMGYIFTRQSASNELEVMSIGVTPEKQRLGLGKALLHGVIERKPQDASVFLEVSEKNEPAVKLYHSMGFQTLSIRKHYYRDDSDALVMKLDLAKS